MTSVNEVLFILTRVTLSIWNHLQIKLTIHGSTLNLRCINLNELRFFYEKRDLIPKIPWDSKHMVCYLGNVLGENSFKIKIKIGLCIWAISFIGFPATLVKPGSNSKHIRGNYLFKTSSKFSFLIFNEEFLDATTWLTLSRRVKGKCAQK